MPTTPTREALAEELRRYINDLANWREDDSEALHEAAWQSALMTVNRLAAPAAKAQSEPQWMLIETAPEEGEFLVYLPEERATVQHARFRKKFNVIGTRFEFDLATKPTHWMPLPQPPKD